VNSFRQNIVLTVFVAALLAGPCPAETAPSETPAYLVVGGGVAGVIDHDKPIIGMVELQPALRIGPLGTWIAFHSTDKDYYLAAGLLWDWYITDRIFITPSVGAGLYEEDDGIDLGHLVEFRSGLECGYDFKEAGRLSVGGWHISNCRLDTRNPGTELLAVRYALPLSWP